MMMPKPRRKVSRSRSVIGRFAGTVSPTGPSIRRRTRRFASSGSSRSTGWSSRSRHSSTRIMAAAAAIGLVIEATRKIVSRRIGSPPSAFRPIASTCTSSRRLTSVTSPGISPRSTWATMSSRICPSRAFENPPLLDVIVSSSPSSRPRPLWIDGGGEARVSRGPTAAPVAIDRRRRTRRGSRRSAGAPRRRPPPW